MLLDTHKISLIYDFWKLNNEENYLHDVNEFSRKLTESDAIDAEYIRNWIPDFVHLVELWEQQSFDELDKFYTNLLTDNSTNDQIDAILRFLYDIQSYELVKYLLEKNVQHYKKEKIVSSTMNGFHESCIYGFSQVCSLYIQNRQNLNETFSLIYENFKTNKKETIRNLTALQLVCLWSKYFPKRFVSYAHTVRLLLNHGARVNMTSTELTTPLHWTCQAKHTTQLAKDLIEHGASINAHDKLNIQPIHYACWSRNLKLIQLLISKGVQLTDQDDFGRTPLHFLCMPSYFQIMTDEDQKEQYEMMKYILDNHKNDYSIDLTKQDIQGHTILVYTCVSQNLSLMKLILEHEPTLLNKSTIQGRTPLMISIDEGFLNGVEHLLKQNGLERNVSDINGNTAIHHVCMLTNPSIRSNILQLLIDDRNGIFDFEKRNEQLCDPFMLCTINQSIDLCRLLIEKNVSLTKKDLYSRQPIHVACQIGNYELVSLIINSSNFNINALDNNNRNCLFYALSCGDIEIVDLLIENGIVIKIRDCVGDTPLHLAVQHPTKAYELTNRLLKTQHGKELINEPAADRMKPILLATTHKQAEVVYLLIKNDVDLTAVDDEHHTALHLACKSGCMKSAFYLIEFGGLNVNELDAYRQTPIFYAFASNDYDLVQYLISCGAQIDIRDNQNYLPLHIGIISSNNQDEYNVKLIDLYKNKYEHLIDDQNNECLVTPLILASMEGKLNVVQHLILNCKVNTMAKCSNGHTALHYASLTHNKTLDTIEFLMKYGCTYENVDQPKGTFLYTVVQYADRQAMTYFIDYWLKTKPDINEVHHCATLLDLLYNRAQIYDHDIDVKYLRNLFEKDARLYSTNLSISPFPLLNDCPSFYLILLENNCSSIVDATPFIFELLNSISNYPENVLLINEENNEFITVCDYFLRVVNFAHYYYSIGELYTEIDKVFFPQLSNQQPSEQIEILRNQLEKLRTTVLKLSEILRKKIHMNVNVPIKSEFQQIGLTRHLVEFLTQSTF